MSDHFLKRSETPYIRFVVQTGSSIDLHTNDKTSSPSVWYVGAQDMTFYCSLSCFLTCLLLQVKDRAFRKSHHVYLLLSASYHVYKATTFCQTDRRR